MKTGSADERKLALAKELGADVTIDVEREDPVSAVRDANGGRLADVVVDVTAYAVEAVTQSINMAKRGGGDGSTHTDQPQPMGQQARTR